MSDPTKPVEDIDEGAELGPLVSKFMQKDSFNAFERILCSHLIEAISGKPLDSIIHICRAALCLDEANRESLELDIDQIKGIYSVSTRLKSSVTKTDKWNIQTKIINFETLDWGLHLAPWVEMKAYSFFLPKDIHEEDFTELSQYDAFILSAKNLTLEGYQHMVSDFLIYAIPKVQEYTRKLSEIISPSTYQEMLALFKSSKGGEKR